MRALLVTAILALAVTPALAWCPIIPDDASTGYSANQARLAVCRANELADRTALRAQELQFQADLQAQVKSFELELRMQQAFAAAGTPPVFVMPGL